MAHREHDIDLPGGGRLHVVERGEGRPLVLLHGIPEDHRSFDALAPLLEARCRLVMPDLPGFGRSTAGPCDSPLHRAAEDVAFLVGHLGLDRPVLLGHDAGGYVALHYALHGLGPVAGLILLNTTYGKIHLARSPHMVLFALPLVGTLLVHLLGPRLADLAFRFGYGDPSRIDPAHLEHCRRMLRQRGTLSAIASFYRVNRNRALSKLFQHPRLIEAFSGPGCVLWGGRDPFLDPRLADWLAQLVPCCRLVRYPACGHFPHQEAPRECAVAIMDYLNSFGESSPSANGGTRHIGPAAR